MSFQLYHGDCMTEMERIATGSVHLVVADLPYGVTNIEWDQKLDFDELWAHYARVLAPGGCVVLFGIQPFTAELVMSNRKWFKYALVWDKNKCGSPGLAKVRPMITHEDVLVFAPGRTTYNPQMTEGAPYSRKSKNPAGYVGRKNDHGYGLKPRTEFTNAGTRYPKSVLAISRDFSAQQQVHPTQKPVPLLAWLVATYSNPGERVLDNVMGSGPAGVAATLLGRDFVGIEADPEYFQIAQARIAAAQYEAEIGDLI